MKHPAIEYSNLNTYTADETEPDVIAQFIAKFGKVPTVIIHDDYWRLGPIDVPGGVFPICQDEPVSAATSEAADTFSSVTLPGFDAVLVPTEHETGQGEGVITHEENKAMFELRAALPVEPLQAPVVLLRAVPDAIPPQGQ